MAGKRDRTHLHTVGEKPNVGRRYVTDGKVRIEWRERGKRRTKTVGRNTPEVRAEADAMLEDLMRPKKPAKKPRAKQTTPTLVQSPVGETDIATSIGDAARAWAVALMDVADVLVERAEGWLTKWTEPNDDAGNERD